MANYLEKYYAEFRNTRKQDYKLTIEVRMDANTTAPTLTKIGTLCGCVLEVQGSQNYIIAPIVKTQLRFSVVDAPDYKRPAAGTKYGDWQEFFTPDATLYRVRLDRILPGGSLENIWRGYITPDSWSESLEYRGAITITARDAIGHLQDFDFDMTPNGDGLVKIADLIAAAGDKIETPMQFWLNEYYTAYKHPEANGVRVCDAYVNASLYDGMNWYEALERTLEAIGYCIRFAGNYTLIVTTLRNIPLLGNVPTPATKSGNVIPGEQVMEFYGGNLELDPAVKQIEENVNFGYEDELELPIFENVSLDPNVQRTYRCAVDGVKLRSGAIWRTGEHDAPYNGLELLDNEPIWGGSSAFLDPEAYSAGGYRLQQEGASWKEYLFIPANDVNKSVKQEFFIYARSTDLTITFRFAEALCILQGGTYLNTHNFLLDKFVYAISYESDSGTRYWNGNSWGSEYTEITAELNAQEQYDNRTPINEVSISLRRQSEDGKGYIRFTIVSLVYKQETAGDKGVYARLSTISIKSKNAVSVTGDHVTTINNSAYNVKLSRSPLFGAMSTDIEFMLPSNYKNAIYYYSRDAGEGAISSSIPKLYPYRVRYEGQTEAQAVPLPVAVHQQILCYYFGAARVLEGNCAPINKGVFYFDRLCVYKGRKYILQGGTMDYFSGIINGAVLREYMDFDDLWSDEQPEYSQQTLLKR